MTYRAIPLTAALALTLAACSESSPPVQAEAQPAAEPKPSAVAAPTTIDAPAGKYQLDPNHASLTFSVTHLGVSNYIMRFSDFDATLDLAPDDLSASSIKVDIDPASIDTDFHGDYQDTHPDSAFQTWQQELAQSPKFLNASEYPDMTFESREISPAGDGSLQVTGDLTLRGQTHPVSLDVRLVDAVAQHPMLGMAALGFSAEGTFERSEFGMTHLVDPPLVGDTVTIRFEGEFHQPAQQEAEASQAQ